MATTVRMMKRNMVWLAIIIAVGVIGWLVFGLLIGLIAAGVTLIISEIVERLARSRRRAARDTV